MNDGQIYALKMMSAKVSKRTQNPRLCKKKILNQIEQDFLHNLVLLYSNYIDDLQLLFKLQKKIRRKAKVLDSVLDSKIKSHVKLSLIMKH